MIILIKYFTFLISRLSYVGEGNYWDQRKIWNNKSINENCIFRDVTMKVYDLA